MLKSSKAKLSYVKVLISAWCLLQKKINKNLVYLAAVSKFMFVFFIVAIPVNIN